MKSAPVVFTYPCHYYIIEKSERTLIYIFKYIISTLL